MNYIVITDIFGNKVLQDSNINSKLPFIIINTTRPQLLLEKVSELSENDSILKIKLPRLFQILDMNKINPSNYSLLGDIWISSKNIPGEISILMVNNNNKISTYPIDFIKIDNYYNINIWKPISPKGYQEIGLIASPNKPSLRSMKVINNQFLNETNNESIVRGRNTNMNEFNFLSNIGIKKFTIDRSKFINNLDNIKILSKENGKYISNDDNNLVLKDNTYQKINYSVQGELKLNDKCIGISMEENMGDGFVYLQNCNDALGQKWYPYKDNFISQYDQGCLTNDKGIIKNKKCNNNDNSQKWIIENSKQDNDLNLLQNSEDVSNKNSWKSAKGKLVMLIESSSPWYDNKKKLFSETIMDQSLDDLNKDNEDNIYDMYKKSEIVDNSSCENENDNYYREKSKIKIKKNFFDNFEGTKKNSFDFNLIACSLMLLIFLLVVVRYCINQNKNN